MNPRTVAIVSGGMDSVVLAYHLKEKGHDLSLLSFDYGQRHRRELASAAFHARRLNVPHHIVDLGSIRPLLGSALTSDDVPVPDGHYAEESMKSTVVPNRNIIMLAIAWGHAVSIQADAVALGAHGGDHFVYPDCRATTLLATEMAFNLANEGLGRVHLLRPFVDWKKDDIAAEGTRLGVDFTNTWSCYKGGDVHCGTCGTCTERKEAFRLAGLIDPTVYEA